jgi:hypothetical protein
VNVHELFGVAVLNALCVFAGLGLVGCRLPAARALTRLGGLVHLVGFVAVMAISVELLVIFGVRPSIGSLTAIALSLGAGGALVRLLRPPARPGEPDTSDEQSTPGLLVGAACFGVVLFMLIDLLRLAYTQGLIAWDAWSFWTPKALAIHEQGLDPHLFGTISAPTYPLLVPVTDASVYAFAGSMDTVPLALQFFVLFAAFVAAVAGLAHVAGARGWLTWPLLATLLVLPAGLVRLLAPQGDFLLDYFFAVGVAAAVVWLWRREPWLLLTALVVMVGVVMTKREGVPFALALAAIVALGAWRTREGRYAAIALVALPVLAQVPWWLWLRHHGISAESSPTVVEGGAIATQVAHKPQLLLPALGAVLRATFSLAWWGGAALVGAAAIAAGLLRRETRQVSALIAMLSALLVAVFVWRLLWGGEGSGTQFESSAYPTRRLTGALVLTWIAVGPLLLGRLVAGLPDRIGRLARVPSRFAYGAAVAPAAVFLAATVLHGDFDSVRTQCHPLTVPGAFGVALGPRTDYVGAIALQRRVLALGFQHTEISADECGGVVLLTPNLDTRAIAESVQQEAESAHLVASIVKGAG